MPLLPASFLDRLAALTLGNRRRGTGASAGQRRSPRRGRSQEFADHRPYVPGDDLRFLDWHLFGRLDALWVKLFEEEEDRVVQCLLDCSASMQGDKLDYARKLAGALAFVALGTGDRVSVTALDEAIRAHAPPRRGRDQAAAVFRAIEEVNPGTRTDLSKALATYPRQRGTGIALLMTDFLYPEGPDDALKRLVARGNEVHAFHLLSPADLRPALGGDLVLQDAETGEELVLTVDEDVLDRYQATMRAWADEMDATCRRLGVTYTRVVTNMPVEDLVLGELRRSGLVGTSR
ncbi:MAG: DUF58 domain-containing protein [Myxococcales bacterium]|nr:DUF58 domain-containing protein [Myxococcales bacterium]